MVEAFFMVYEIASRVIPSGDKIVGRGLNTPNKTVASAGEKAE